MAGTTGLPPDALTERFGRIPLSSTLPAAEVIRTGQPVVVTSAAERRARYPDLDSLRLDLDPSFVVLPLKDALGRPFGSMGVGFDDPGGVPSDETDRDLLENVAAQCALALDRARLADAAERDQTQLAFLDEISGTLSSSLDVDTALTQLAEMVVPRIADWCVVRLMASPGSPRPLMGVAHVDPTQVDPLHAAGPPAAARPRGGRRARRGARRRPPAHPRGPRRRHARPAVRHARRPRCDGRGGRRRAGRVPAAGPGSSARRHRLRRPAGASRSPMPTSRWPPRSPAAPASSSTTPACSTSSPSWPGPCRTASCRAACPTSPGIELGARYRAAGQGLDVGGDFYDAFPADRNWWIIAVGDVCGHGVEAAATTGVVRHTIRSSAFDGVMPSTLLRRLNELLLRNAAERDEIGDDDLPVSPRFCTVLVGAVQPTDNGVDIILCSAGHPLPLVRRTAGPVVPVGIPGTLLGVTDEVSLSDTVVHLDPGETLVCFTDGLTDRRKGRRTFGEEGVVKALYQGKGLDADELARLIESEALGYVDDEPADDMAVLTLRATPR